MGEGRKEVHWLYPSFSTTTLTPVWLFGFKHGKTPAHPNTAAHIALNMQ